MTNPSKLIELAETRDRIIHGLRMQGWSRIEAENEADERCEKLRARAALNNTDIREG